MFLKKKNLMVFFGIFVSKKSIIIIIFWILWFIKVFFLMWYSVFKRKHSYLCFSLLLFFSFSASHKCPLSKDKCSFVTPIEACFCFLHAHVRVTVCECSQRPVVNMICFNFFSHVLFMLLNLHINFREHTLGINSTNPKCFTAAF